MNEAVQYSYTEGLDVSQHDFLKSGERVAEDQSIDPILLTFPKGFEETRSRVQDAVKAAQRYKTPSGADLEYGVLSAENDYGEVTVINPGWGADFHDPLYARDLIAYAMKNPDMAFLFYNAPGVGASSPLPPSMAKELAKTGRYRPAGREVLETLKPALLPFKEIDLIGESLGARYAIGLAASAGEVLNRQVRELRVLDPVGSKKQSFLELLWAFMKVEGEHGGRYAEASTDDESRRIQKEQDRPLWVLKKMLKLALNGGVGQIQALCHDAVAADLAQALPNIAIELQVASPEFSALTDSSAVERTLLDLARQKERPILMGHQILVGRTHASMAGNPAVRAELLAGF